MSSIGNLVWLIFGGLIAGIIYIIGGLALCLTIIGIPFGIKTINLGVAALTPFGKRVEQRENVGLLSLIFNVVWLVLFGWEIALTHLIFALLLGVTIIGIPFARQHLKLVRIGLLPFSYQLTSD